MAVFDLLHRFRRLGAPPGRPTQPVGVPVREEEILWAELAPLTGDLDRIAAEKRQILEQAEALAEQRRAAAGAQVQAILDDARVAAADIRKRASAGRRSEIQREADQLRVRGADEASRIRSVSKKRIPTLAAEVVDCVLRTPE